MGSHHQAHSSAGVGVDPFGDERDMAIRIKARSGESPEQMLRRFKKLVERSGLKGEIRAHEYYEKPCEARSRKAAKRKSTIRKAAAGTLKKPKPAF